MSCGPDADHPSSRLDVEISVVNHDNRELVTACLRSLTAACEGLTWHATVIDNASTDGSPEMLEEHFREMRLIRNDRRRGFGANHNQVLDDVVGRDKARYVLVLNDDTELDKFAVTRLVRYADSRPAVAAVGPTTRDAEGRPHTTWFRFPTMWSQIRQVIPPVAGVAHEYASTSTTGWLCGSCLLLRTEALRQVGIFDERFYLYCEDADLGLRLRRAGYRSECCPEATIVHIGHQSVVGDPHSRDFERQGFRSQYLFLCKHNCGLVATLGSMTVRVILFSRAVKAICAAVLLNNDRERTNASRLLDLARYDPRVPLAHERKG